MLKILLRSSQINFSWSEGIKGIFRRCTAVNNPYKYREKNIHNLSLNFIKIILVIICGSVSVNIPRFFETEIVRSTSASDVTELEKSEENLFSYKVTPLRIDPIYIW